LAKRSFGLAPAIAARCCMPGPQQLLDASRARVERRWFWRGAWRFDRLGRASARGQQQ
jgi:hypothetical protein